MKKFIAYGIITFLAGTIIMASCSDKETPGSVFPDAAFILETEQQDTLRLTGFGTREIYLYYGNGVADNYMTTVTWETNNADIITVKNYGRSVRGDSCFSIASVTPTEKEGNARITVTLAKDGRQQSLQLPVTTNGMVGIDLSTLPEGAFADTVGKAAFAMILVKADTVINVGERWGIEFDTLFWKDYPPIEKRIVDSLYEVWRYEMYDLSKWNEDSVYIADFYVGQKEVTMGLWKEIMGYGLRNGVASWYEDGKYTLYGKDRLINLRYDRYNFNLPVWDATFSECEEFIRKLRERTGIPYRLLTHAEYQFACDGGKKGPAIDTHRYGFVYYRLKGSPKITNPNSLGLYNMARYDYSDINDAPEWTDGVCYRYHTQPIWIDSIWYDADGYKHYTAPSHYDTIYEARPRFGGVTDITTHRILINNLAPYGEIPSFLYAPNTAGLRLGLSAADWRKLKGIK